MAAKCAGCGDKGPTETVPLYNVQFASGVYTFLVQMCLACRCQPEAMTRARASAAAEMKGSGFELYDPDAQRAN